MGTSIKLVLVLAALALFFTIYGMAIKSKAVWLPGLCFLVITALIYWAAVSGEGFIIPLGSLYAL